MTKISKLLFSHYHVDEMMLASLLVLLSSFHYFIDENYIAYFILIISLPSFILSINLLFTKKEKNNYSRFINFVVSIFSIYVAILYFYSILTSTSIDDFKLLNPSNIILLYILFTILRALYIFITTYLMLLSSRIVFKELESSARKMFNSLPEGDIKPKFKLMSLIAIVCIVAYYLTNQSPHIENLTTSFFAGLLILNIINTLPKKIIIKN